MDYTDTISKLAREAEVTAATVRLYADMGWLDCVRSSNGARLFKPGQGPRVREIYTERVANSGRPRKAQREA